VPEADPVAYARMKYELENHTKTSLPGHFFGAFRTSPNMKGRPNRKPADDRSAAHHPGQRSAGCRWQPGRELRGFRLDGGRQFRHRQESGRARHSAWAGRRRGRYRHYGKRHPAGSRSPAASQQSTVTRTGLDINTASVAELQKLPGVNKLQAQRIVAMRPFLSIQDLIRTGLPQKAINQLKPAAKAPAAPRRPPPRKNEPYSAGGRQPARPAHG